MCVGSMIIIISRYNRGLLRNDNNNESLFGISWWLGIIKGIESNLELGIIILRYIIISMSLLGI